MACWCSFKQIPLSPGRPSLDATAEEAHNRASLSQMLREKAGSPMTSADIRDLVQQVDVQRLRADVAALAIGERHNLFSPGRHAAAQEYLRATFHASGLEMRQHTFTHSGLTGINLLARKEGSDPILPPLMVSAHYDTVPGSPGADDNASGVAALLECARVLASAPALRSVEFVAFDMEEIQAHGDGLIGSAASVRDLAPSTRYEGLFNLEMVGFASGPGTQSFPMGFQVLFPTVYRHVEERDFRGDFLAVVSQGGSITLSQRLVAAAAEHVPELDLVSIEVRDGMPIPPDVFRSDHAPFWAAGIPAVMVTDTANFRNPHYHTPGDDADTLDYAFLHSVTRTLLATLAEYAGA